MTRFAHPLDDIKIASPCRMDWNAMSGDERVRFCGACRLNVYNLSGMTRREAEALLARREGRMCVRIFRRKDGTVLTQDCPVGLRALRRMRAVLGAALAAVVSALSALGFQKFKGASTCPPGVLMGEPAIMGDVVAVPEHLMGKIAAPEGP